MSDERLDHLERRVARLEAELAVRRSSLVEPRGTTNDEPRTPFDLALAGHSLTDGIAIGLAFMQALTGLWQLYLVWGLLIGVGTGMGHILQQVGFERIARWLPFSISTDEIQQQLAAEKRARRRHRRRRILAWLALLAFLVAIAALVVWRLTS